MKKYYTIILTTSLLSLSACSSSEKVSFGQMIQTESYAGKAIGEQWEKGDALVKEGFKLTKDGEKDISKAKKLTKKGKGKIEDGEDLIAKGKALKKKSENQYSVVNTPPPADPAPRSVIENEIDGYEAY